MIPENRKIYRYSEGETIEEIFILPGDYDNIYLKIGGISDVALPIKMEEFESFVDDGLQLLATIKLDKEKFLSESMTSFLLKNLAKEVEDKKDEEGK